MSHMRDIGIHKATPNCTGNGKCSNGPLVSKCVGISIAVIVSIYISCLIFRICNRSKAISRLQEHGVSVLFRERRPPWLRTVLADDISMGMNDIQELDTFGHRIGDLTFCDVLCLSEIETIIGNDSIITDEAVAQLAKLPNLKYLELDRTGITNSGLKAVGKCHELKWLSISGTSVSDEGLIYLHRLEKVGEITLFNTRVTTKGLDSLQDALPETNIMADVDHRIWRKRSQRHGRR